MTVNINGLGLFTDQNVKSRLLKTYEHFTLFSTTNSQILAVFHPDSLQFLPFILALSTTFSKHLPIPLILAETRCTKDSRS